MKRCTCLICIFYSFHAESLKKNKEITLVSYSDETPTIDRNPTERLWNTLQWRPIDQNWIGDAIDNVDFNGNYKIAWNEDGLYLLLEIVDDSLYKKTKDFLKLWWNDDCVVIYIDEDNSGGLHQFNHNAFTYHVALDGNVADLGEDKKPELYNEHILSAHQTFGTTTVWELKVNVYPGNYHDGSAVRPVILKVGKKIGFALAYADNDQSNERENLIGSVFISGEGKNQGWIDANIFGTLQLVH